MITPGASSFDRSSVDILLDVINYIVFPLRLISLRSSRRSDPRSKQLHLLMASGMQRRGNISLQT